MLRCWLVNRFQTVPKTTRSRAVLVSIHILLASPAQIRFFRVSLTLCFGSTKIKPLVTTCASLPKTLRSARPAGHRRKPNPVVPAFGPVITMNRWKLMRWSWGLESLLSIGYFTIFQHRIAEQTAMGKKTRYPSEHPVWACRLSMVRWAISDSNT